MTDRFVGPGGSDASNGLSWANRKLTLNGVEDTPVVAGDTVIVGPGTYRESLTCDVSGTVGSPITYIGDVTGYLTDGIGGEVRVTGSDNDTTATRTECIQVGVRNYRTFRGFTFDFTTTNGIGGNSTNGIIEDCCFRGGANITGINLNGASHAAWTVRRCYFRNIGHAFIVQHSSVLSNVGHLMENCISDGRQGMFRTTRVGGCIVRNCVCLAGSRGVWIQTALTAGQTVTVDHCILCNTAVGALIAINVGEIVEDYNLVFNNVADRTNVSTGANSVAYSPLDAVPLLFQGMTLPFPFVAELSPASQVRRIAGNGSESAEDFFGKTRPATSAKKSWGAFQFTDVSREVTTVRTGSYSAKLAEAGRLQFQIPVTAVSTTISVYVQWEADYTGTKPQMVIKQPGVADRTTTATGASGSWELLTDTFTPAATTDFVIVELVSGNTAASTNFDVFFDDAAISPAPDPGFENWLTDRLMIAPFAQDPASGASMLVHPGMSGGMRA